MTRLYIMIREPRKIPVLKGFWKDTRLGLEERDKALAELLESHFEDNLTLLTVTEFNVWATSVTEWKLEQQASKENP